VRDPVERKRLVLAVLVTKTSACHEKCQPPFGKQVMTAPSAIARGRRGRAAITVTYMFSAVSAAARLFYNALESLTSEGLLAPHSIAVIKGT
jgi:hypothetical protein